jgi:hypothetical protein
MLVLGICSRFFFPVCSLLFFGTKSAAFCTIGMGLLYRFSHVYGPMAQVDPVIRIFCLQIGIFTSPGHDRTSQSGTFPLLANYWSCKSVRLPLITTIAAPRFPIQIRTVNSVSHICSPKSALCLGTDMGRVVSGISGCIAEGDLETDIARGSWEGYRETHGVSDLVSARETDLLTDVVSESCIKK